MTQTKGRVLAGGERKRYALIIEALEEIGAELVVVPPVAGEELVAAAQGMDAIVAMPLRFPQEVIERLPASIQAIVYPSVGLDTIDVEAATERGIMVVNIVGIFEEEVAAHALALILALGRRLFPLDTHARAGGWVGSVDMDQIYRVYDQTLGLIAFGNIPRVLAPVVRAMRMQTLAYDPYLEPGVDQWHGVRLIPLEEALGDGVRLTTLEEVLSEADFVSCHLPLTSETYHMLGEREFRLMKPTAYFVNTGRGKVVDEVALVRALKEGWIAGAGLDVFEEEPLSADSPLLQLDNVILTPHVGGGSNVSFVRRRRRMGEELVRILTGRWPKVLANPAVREKLGPRED